MKKLGLTVALFLTCVPIFAAADNALAQSITVLSATYGRNCGAPWGNVTGALYVCNNRQECRYRIDYRNIGDPAKDCPKEFRAAWRCDNYPAPPTRHSGYVSPEAGFGDRSIYLSCP